MSSPDKTPPDEWETCANCGQGCARRKENERCERLDVLALLTIA